MRRFEHDFQKVLLVAVVMLLGCSTANKRELSSEERARMLIQIANGALLEGDPVGALENLAAAEAIEPDLPELHHSKAIAYHSKGDSAVALNSVRRAVELKPDYSDANNTLGKILLDMGRSDEALSPLLKAAKDPLYRESHKPLTSLGIYHYRKGQDQKARDYFDQAIRAGKGNACIAHYYRGHLSLKQSRLIDAIFDYDQATRRACAGFAEAHLALGVAYARNKQFDLARRKFVEIQSQYPSTRYARQAVDELQGLP